MIFNICYKNRGNVLLSVDVYMKSEQFYFDDNKKWRVELNTKVDGHGIARYVFDTIKDDTSLRILQNKLLPLQELRGWVNTSSEFNNNLYTILDIKIINK